MTIINQKKAGINHKSMIPLLVFLKRKKGKRGIIRVLEAIISIVILLGFIIVVLSNNVQSPDTSENVYRIQHQVLREVANNYTIRIDVLNGITASAINYIGDRISPFPLNFSTTLCKPEESCRCSACPTDREIYADEIIISTNLTDYSPKKLVLFFWTMPNVFKKVVVEEECGDGICSANENEISCPADCAAAQICSPSGTTRTSWYNGVVSTSNCKKTETCNADGSAWDLTTDWSVTAESGDIACEDSLDNDCDGYVNDPIQDDCPLI